ncbi:MAG: hypothetical protein HY344_03455 [Candidatus Levybacteria bacterium]|nr:hypothetical protein [Candidatus Levybacteria bacterium]
MANKTELLLEGGLAATLVWQGVNIYNQDSQRSLQLQGEQPIKRGATCPVTGEWVFDIKKGEERILGGGLGDGITERLDEVLWGNTRPKIQSLGEGKYLIYPVAPAKSIGDNPTTVQSGINTYTASSIGGTPTQTTMKVLVSFPC